jgi:hypothetical protein
MARDPSTWNGLDAWHRTGSTVSGFCRGWESEHRRDQAGRVPAEPQAPTTKRAPTETTEQMWARVHAECEASMAAHRRYRESLKL